MKNNKKIVALAAAAIMAISAVSASAATVPVPANANQAFTIAESFYYDGLYYEAKQELEYVQPNLPGYNEAKKNAWMDQVNLQIDRLEIAQHLDKVREYVDQNRLLDALIELAQADAHFGKNESDFYSISYWQGVINEKLGLNSTVIDSAEKAVKAVMDVYVDVYDTTVTPNQWVGKKYLYRLSSSDEWYCPVRVWDGEYAYHVYVQTQVPGNGAKDVAAYRVRYDGTVEKAF